MGVESREVQQIIRELREWHAAAIRSVWPTIRTLSNQGRLPFLIRPLLPEPDLGTTPPVHIYE